MQTGRQRQGITSAKARYNKWINADLKKLDSLTALKLEHMMDLEL